MKMTNDAEHGRELKDDIRDNFSDGLEEIFVSMSLVIKPIKGMST